MCCLGAVRSATLNAGVGNDILIGGWTNYDVSSSGKAYRQKLAAPDAIMAGWGSSVDSYATRLNKLAAYLNITYVHERYVSYVRCSPTSRTKSRM